MTLTYFTARPIFQGHWNVKIKSQFQRSSLKSLGRSSWNFMWSLLGQWHWNLYAISWSHDQDCHMTKMAAMPIYGKNPSTIFSRTGGPISRYVAPCFLLKCWPWDDNFGNISFYMGKKEQTMDILETIAAWDLKVARCRQLMESMNVCNQLRSRSFLDLDPRSLKYQN